MKSSPQAYGCASSPPRAAHSHSASVGSVLPVPRRECLGVAERHVDNRVRVEPGERAVGSVGMAPVGAAHERPPVAEVAPVDGARGLHEHHRAGVQHLWQRARVVSRIGWDLREGRVTGGLDEPGKSRVRDREPIDPEPIDRHLMHWPLFRIVLVRSHAERAAGDPHHVRGRRFAGRRESIGIRFDVRRTASATAHHIAPFARSRARL